MRLISMVDAAATLKPEDCDNRMYQGVMIYRSKEGVPVALMSSRSANPPRWCVIAGFSNCFYNSYRAAVKACEDQGYTFVSCKRNPVTL